MHGVVWLSRTSFLIRALVLGLATLFISGLAHAIAQPARDNSAPTSDLVDAIVTGNANPGQVPEDFVGSMGYTPLIESGTLLHPNGGCSTPGEVGPGRFSKACKTHDLGYDLLRYAELDGQRLSAKARLELDWKFYLDLLESCETPTCSVTATAYYCAVSANSIRQGYKAPHHEPTTPWMALTTVVVGLSALGGMPSFRSRVDRCCSLARHRLHPTVSAGPKQLSGPSRRDTRPKRV